MLENEGRRKFSIRQNVCSDRSRTLFILEISLNSLVTGFQGLILIMKFFRMVRTFCSRLKITTLQLAAIVIQRNVQSRLHRITFYLFIFSGSTEVCFLLCFSVSPSAQKFKFIYLTWKKVLRLHLVDNLAAEWTGNDMQSRTERKRGTDVHRSRKLSCALRHVVRASSMMREKGGNDTRLDHGQL